MKPACKYIHCARRKPLPIDARFFMIDSYIYHTSHYPNILIPSPSSSAAASAVNAALAASKPKSKPLTAKQRLGKIMGLSKGGRWK